MPVVLKLIQTRNPAGYILISEDKLKSEVS